MKNSILIAVFSILFSTVAYTQDSSRMHEAGIIFNSLNSFGVTYRVGTPTSLWRFNAVGLNTNTQVSTQTNAETTTKNYNGTFRVGKEFRKIIDENFALRLGADLVGSFNTNKSDRNDISPNNFDTYSNSNAYGIGAGMVLGLNYKVKRLIIGAEILPTIQYSRQTTKSGGTNLVEQTVKTSGTSVTILSSSAFLSIAYQF